MSLDPMRCWPHRRETRLTEIAADARARSPDLRLPGKQTSMDGDHKRSLRNSCAGLGPRRYAAPMRNFTRPSRRACGDQEQNSSRSAGGAVRAQQPFSV